MEPFRKIDAKLSQLNIKALKYLPNGYVLYDEE